MMIMAARSNRYVVTSLSQLTIVHLIQFPKQTTTPITLPSRMVIMISVKSALKHLLPLLHLKVLSKLTIEHATNMASSSNLTKKENLIKGKFYCILPVNKHHHLTFIY